MTVVCPFYTGHKAVFLWALLAWAYEKRSNSSAEQRWVQIERAAWPPHGERTTRPRCLRTFSLAGHPSGGSSRPDLRPRVASSVSFAGKPGFYRTQSRPRRRGATSLGHVKRRKLRRGASAGVKSPPYASTGTPLRQAPSPRSGAQSEARRHGGPTGTKRAPASDARRRTRKEKTT